MLSVIYIAICFCIEYSYNFLVYNASIIFWKYARAFLKVNFKRYLCNSLKKIIISLREIDDADFEWRAILERTLIEAYLDNKQIDEAKHLAVELNKFIKKNLKNLFDDFFEFLVNCSFKKYAQYSKLQI